MQMKDSTGLNELAQVASKAKERVEKIEDRVGDIKSLVSAGTPDRVVVVEFKENGPTPEEIAESVQNIIGLMNNSSYEFDNHQYSSSDDSLTVFFKATNKDKIHQALPESDYEAACNATGLYASTMKGLQDMLVTSTKYGNQENWGTLTIKTIDSPVDSLTYQFEYSMFNFSGDPDNPPLDKSWYVLEGLDRTIGCSKAEYAIKSKNTEDFTEPLKATEAALVEMKPWLSEIKKIRNSICSAISAEAEQTIDEGNIQLAALSDEIDNVGFFNFSEKRRLKNEFSDMGDLLGGMLLESDGFENDIDQCKRLVEMINRFDPENANKRRKNSIELLESLDNLSDTLSDLEETISAKRGYLKDTVKSYDVKLK